jgi:hypothetical protein
VEVDVLIDSETLLVTDLMNLKIKSTQSFKDTYKNKVYVCVRRSECSYIYIYMNIYVNSVFKK